MSVLESSEVFLKQLIKEDASAYFESLVKNEEHVIWDENSFVGSINLKLIDSGAEIGYWLDGHCVGNGYATITSRALADYYKKIFDRLYDGTKVDNIDSQAVLIRAGFEKRSKYEDGLIFCL